MGQNEKTHEKGDGSTKRAIRLGLEFISDSSKGGGFSSSSSSLDSVIVILLLVPAAINGRSLEDLTLEILNSLLLLDLLYSKD